MTARTDRSDPSRYSPAYAMGIPRGGSRVAEGDALSGVRERIRVLVEVGSRNRAAIEFLGAWERVNNPNFNYGEFAIIKSQAGLNSYKLSAKEWMEKIWSKLSRQKGMNTARQRLRRFGRSAGARTRSAVADCIVNTVSFVMESRYAYV